MAECKTTLRGDEVICLTHNQRYAGCVLDERDRLRAEVGRLNEAVECSQKKVKVAELQLSEERKRCSNIVAKHATHHFHEVEGEPNFKVVGISTCAERIQSEIHKTRDLRIKEICVKCEHPRSQHTAGGGCLMCHR